MQNRSKFNTYSDQGVQAHVRPLVLANHLIQAAQEISIAGASPVIAPKLAQISQVDELVRVNAVSGHVTEDDP